MKIIIAAILLTVIAVTGLNFAGAFAITVPSASPTPHNSPMMSVPWTPIIPIRSHWVRLDGNITTWGTQEVKGALTLMAATTSQSRVPARWLDSANAIWTNTTNFRQDGNISYNFYAARLVEANFTMTDFQGNNFYLNGTWSVVNVNITRTVIKTGNSETGYSINVQSSLKITPVETKVYGELNVTNQWSEFTLNITGIPLLSGTVHRSIERQTMFNRFDIINAGTDNIVTRADLRAISNDYGAVPGMPNYDESMDFHGTYQIDICDIATVAANVQS